MCDLKLKIDICLGKETSINEIQRKTNFNKLRDCYSRKISYRLRTCSSSEKRNSPKHLQRSKLETKQNWHTNDSNLAYLHGTGYSCLKEKFVWVGRIRWCWQMTGSIQTDRTGLYCKYRWECAKLRLFLVDEIADENQKHLRFWENHYKLSTRFEFRFAASTFFCFAVLKSFSHRLVSRSMWFLQERKKRRSVGSSF